MQGDIKDEIENKREEALEGNNGSRDTKKWRDCSVGKESWEKELDL